jgi:hypothetical protein
MSNGQGYSFDAKASLLTGWMKPSNRPAEVGRWERE